MKKLKNIFYIICSSFFILTLTLSCGDQQSSTNEDIDYMEDEAFGKLMEEEVIGGEGIRDGMPSGRNKRRERRRRKNLASSDPMSVDSTGCIIGDSDYLACKYNLSRQITDMALNKKEGEEGKGNLDTLEIHNCILTEDNKVTDRVQLTLAEYSYIGNKPKDALLCEIQQKIQQEIPDVIGYAHKTPEFCRDNNKEDNRDDSLNESLQYYIKRGYQCTKADKTHPAAAGTTKKEEVPAATTNMKEASSVSPANPPAVDNPSLETLKPPPWVEKEE